MVHATFKKKPQKLRAEGGAPTKAERSPHRSQAPEGELKNGD